MFNRLIVAVVAFVVASSIATQQTAAGPVERELRQRASDVAVPVQRPFETRKLPPPKTPEKEGMPAPEIAAGTVEPTFDEACYVALSKTAVISRASPPLSKDPQCLIPSPIILHRTSGNQPVKFAQGLLLDCNFARQLAQFSSSTLQNLASKHLNTDVTELRSGQGFVCRRRNNLPTGKLSEHSFGNAIDLLGFKFADGSSLNIRSTADMPPQQAGFSRQCVKSPALPSQRCLAPAQTRPTPHICTST